MAERPAVLSVVAATALITLGACSKAPRPGTDVPPRLEMVNPLSGGLWTEYRVDNQGTPVHAFIRADATAKPVVVLLQGSGCLPLFTVDGEGAYHGTTLFDDVIRDQSDRFHFVLIEKRGVSALRFPAGMPRDEQIAQFGRVQNGECSSEYFAAESKDVRVADTSAVIQAVAHAPWAKDILVVGHSEGTRVAAGLARTPAASKIRALALLSSTGLLGARNDPSHREQFRASVEWLQRLQTASEDERIEGLTGRRWKSYTITATPLDDLRDTTIPVFVAHGGREPDLLGADIFVLEMLRFQPKRPLRYVVVADGDHAFETSTHVARIGQLFDDFTSWSASLPPSITLGVIE